MNNMDYRMVLALVLVPEGEIDDLESDFHHLCSIGGMEAAKVVWADSDTYNEYGQVTKNGPDEGTYLMAKVGPGIPAGGSFGTIDLAIHSNLAQGGRR